MNKNTRKCPNCGAIMGINMKYCRKCRTKMDSGRVEILSTPAGRESSRVQDDDALRNLPKPVRPAENTSRSGDGFFAPGAGGETGDTPRPASTARTAADLDRGNYSGGSRNKKKTWQIAAVLGAICAIIAVAVVLVVKLNKPADSVQTSQTFGNEPPISVTAPPSPSPEPTAEPVVTAKPEVVLPPAGNNAENDPAVPTATPMPTPEPTATPGYTVTEANDTVYITGGEVNIRTGPGTEYNALGSESAGYELHRTGRTSNGWSRVQYSGGEAYVYEAYLSTDQPASTSAPPYTVTEASGTVKVRTASNLRSGPGTGYGVITTVSAGTELTRTGTSGGWTRVSYNNQTAFISTDLLEGESSTSSDTAGSTDGTLSGTVTITGNGVRIRTGPGTNYSIISSVNSGTTLTVSGKEGNWYKVTYNGQTGYVSADYARED